MISRKDQLAIVAFQADEVAYLSMKDCLMPSRFRKLRARLYIAVTTLRLRLFPRPTYVIVYDRHIEPGVDETVEEYYGYFSSPDEARAVWSTYAEGIIGAENVKLCRVVDNWPSEGQGASAD